MLMYLFFLLQFVSTLYIYLAKFSLLFKAKFVMSLTAIQNVLSLFNAYLSSKLMM